MTGNFKGKTSRVSKKTLTLIQLALLTAIIFVFEMTGIGFIPIYPFEIVIMMVPVIIGAVSLGKGAGAFLGGMFGITSVMQCFGKSAVGMLILSMNPFYTVVLNIGVRVLVGFLTGLAFEIFKKYDKTRIWSYILTGLFGSLLNSFLYIFTLALFFGGTAKVQTELNLIAEGEQAVAFGTFFITVFLAVLVNVIVEAVACSVIGGTAAKAVDGYLKKAAN